MIEPARFPTRELVVATCDRVVTRYVRPLGSRAGSGSATGSKTFFRHTPRWYALGALAFSLALALACHAPPARRETLVGTPTRAAHAARSATGPALAHSTPRAPPNSEPTDPSDALTREVAGAIGSVEAVRELRSLRPIPGERLGRDAVIARIAAKVEREIPKAALEAQGELLRGFELIGPDYDFVAGIFALFKTNVAGLYDQDTKTMVLLDDLSGAIVDQTLAHELVHALQDQHFDLGPLLKYRAGDSDRVTAQHALAEGDATSAMIDASSAVPLTPEQLRLVMVSSVAMSGEGATTPRVLQAALVSPYVDGFAFVQELRQRGGWREVDRAWRRPPASTEQLLHLDKYDATEVALAVPEPPLPPGEGWLRLDADVLGEQGLRQTFEQWTTRKEAADGAAGWGGDRYLVARRAREGGLEHAVAWHVRFDAQAHANEAAVVLKKAMAPCRERADLGALAWQRRGDALAIVASGYRRAKDGRLTSSSTCRDGRAWLDKILAAP